MLLLAMDGVTRRPPNGHGVLHDALDGALGGRPGLDPAACAAAGAAFLALAAAGAWASGRRVLEAA